MTTYTWVGGVGSFLTSSNWSPSGVPGPFDTVIIPTGVITVSGNAANGVYIGGTTTAQGSLTLTGNGVSLITPGGVNIGPSAGGSASLLISGGAVLSDTGYNAAGGASGVYALIGNTAGGSGQVLVTGAGSAWNVGGNALAIANYGNGDLTVANGGSVAVTYAADIGVFAGTTGLLTLESGGTLGFGTVFTVGNLSGAFAEVNILAGSTLTATTANSTNTSSMTIGNSAGAVGVVNVSGANANLNMAGNQISVGYSGDGALNINSGATVEAGYYLPGSSYALFVGRYSGSDGTVDVDGAGTSLTATGYTDIGRGGEATMTVTDSAIATLGDATDAVDVGGGPYATNGASGQPGGTGDLQVNSGGMVDAVSVLHVGYNGSTGTLEVSNGGVVEAGSQIGIGDASSSSNYAPGIGIVTVDAGGTLEAGVTTSPGMKPSIYVGDTSGSVGTLNVEGAAALVNANGYRIAVGAGLSGQHTIGGTGFMTVSEGATAESGSTATGYAALIIGGATESEGTLTIEDKGSAFTAAGQAVIGDYGRGHLQIGNGGALATGSASASASSGFVIANVSGSTGDVTVAGAGSTLTNKGNFLVGNAGVGTMTVEDGGGVTTALVSGEAGDAADIAAAAGSDGSAALVTGAASSWAISGTLGIGLGGNGSLVINDGGQVSAVDVNVGAASGITGNLTLTANDLPGSAQATTFLAVSDTLNVGVLGYGQVNLAPNTALEVVKAFNEGAYGSVVGDGVVDPAVSNINGSYTATGTLASAQVNVGSTGVIAPSGGTLTITGAVDGSGAIDIGPGDGVILDGPVNHLAEGLTVAFTGGSALLDIRDPGQFSDVIAGYQSGDTVEVYDPAAAGAAPTSAIVGGNTVLTFADGHSLTFAGAAAPAPSLVEYDATPACFGAGTLIATADGETAVEALRIGDLVRTAAGALQPVRWIGRRSYAGRFAARNPNVLPILIRAGALDEGVPQRDLRVSPLHAMYLDGLLIPAIDLVNGLSVVHQKDTLAVEYFHVELETHDVVIAEGALSESFVDDNSRPMFNNAAEYSSLYPDAVETDARFCAPRRSDGFEVEAIRQRVNARAITQPTCGRRSAA